LRIYSSARIAENYLLAAASLRSRGETKHLGILIFSASAESLKDYKSYYADGFIKKSFNLTFLSGKVKSLLSWSPVRKKRPVIQEMPGQIICYNYNTCVYACLCYERTIAYRVC